VSRFFLFPLIHAAPFLGADPSDAARRSQPLAIDSKNVAPAPLLSGLGCQRLIRRIYLGRWGFVVEGGASAGRIYGVRLGELGRQGEKGAAVLYLYAFYVGRFGAGEKEEERWKITERTLVFPEELWNDLGNHGVFFFLSSVVGGVAEWEV
jgi:hypothetical protein